MLQRAASNAYSWWWSSHIRTKQSKWLEHNLEDMEEKVKYILEILDQDGDSFAKRAEMYYKKRPELISFVRDSFCSYRALAERYDHLSRELQNANRTIATVFPEQVQFSADDEDEHQQQSKHPNQRRKGEMKQEIAAPTTGLPSGLTKEEALQEIDRMQKAILSLQTEKEFMKGCYENGYTKYCDIERRITEMQTKVSNLQDEFGIGTVIEDDEARKLMAETALNSCKETLSQLQHKQENSSEEARLERVKVDEATEKFHMLKSHLLNTKSSTESTQKLLKINKEEVDHDSLKEELIRKQDLSSSTSTNMTELADKIDELVNKVIYLESTISSQASLVSRLRLETGELQEHVQSLEEEKDSLVEDSHSLGNKVRDLEEELRRVKNLNQSVEDESHSIQTRFTEASCRIDHLSHELQNVKQESLGDGSLFPSSNSVRDIIRNGDEDSSESEDSEPYVVSTEGNTSGVSVHVSSDDVIDSTDSSVIDIHVASEKTDSNFKFRKGGNAEFEGEYKKGESSIEQSPSEVLSPRQRLLSEFLLDPIDAVAESDSLGFSDIESKFRSQIDFFLEANLDFYFRFSTSLHQIQKFQSSVDDLRSELLKLKKDGSRKHQSLESEVKPIYRHLREIQSELSLFSDQNFSLKHELHTRFLSLDEMSSSLKAESRDLDKDQVTLFQGEVMNMKRENKKVCDELESGLDRVKRIQVEVEKTLSKLDEEFGILSSRNRAHSRQMGNASRIPLRSFLFGVKMKKQKPSFFSCMSPALQKQYSDLGYGAPLPGRKPRV